MSSSHLSALAALWLAAACGAVASRGAVEIRRELVASGLDEAQRTAPDLVAAAYAALEAAERAEISGDRAAFDDHVTRARLFADAALSERERAQADRERLELERRATELEEQILSDEREARAIEAAARHAAASRAAREELLRALELAERDDMPRGRRSRVSIGNEVQVRRAAVAIREHAQLLAAAASALGADATALARVRELAERSATCSVAFESLELAGAAHAAARHALATARRNRAGPSVEEVRAAAEAAESEGFRAVRLERGLGIEVDGLFRPGSARPTPHATRRLERLAALLTSHPHGPLALEIDVAGADERATTVARERGQWALRALIAAGVSAERLSFRPPDVMLPSPARGERLRVVLLAYALDASAVERSDGHPASEPR